MLKDTEPSLVFEQGVRTAVGFNRDILCYQANAWVEDFFEQMKLGKTVEDACKYLDEYGGYGSTGLASYTIYGDTSLTLDPFDGL